VRYGTVVIGWILGLLSLVFADLAMAHPNFRIEEPYVRVVMPSGPTTTDPHATLSSVNYAYLRHFYEPLFELNANHNLVPILVDRVERTGAREWMLYLRDGIIFHNGKQLRADDVIYTFCRLQQPVIRRTWAVFHQVVSEFMDVDLTSIRIKTRIPVADIRPYLRNLLIIQAQKKDISFQGISWSPAPAKTHASVQAKKKKPEHTGQDMKDISPQLQARCAHYQYPSAHDFAGNEIQGTGAYRLRNALGLPDDDASTTFVPFKDYREPGKLPLVTYYEKSAWKRMWMVLRAEVDIGLQLPQQIYRVAAQKHDFKIEAFPSARIMYLVFHAPKDAFSDRNQQIRKFFADAVDRSEITRRIFSGLFVPLSTFISSPYNIDLDFMKNKSPLVRAVPFEMQDLQLKIGVPEKRYLKGMQVANLLQQQAAKYGIYLNVSSAPFPVYLRQMLTGAYDAFLIGWLDHRYSHEAMYNRLFGAYFSYIRAEKVSSLQGQERVLRQYLDALQAHKDVNGTKAIEKLDQWMVRNHFVIPLYHEVNISAVRKGIAMELRSDDLFYGFNIKKTD
jgi:peptide/nickel transport system substrate-binding protein